MQEPLNARSMPTKPGERVIDKPELPPQGLIIRQYADCEAGDGMHKVARHRHFTIVCDEPADLGGADQHPQPLTYICAGVGFWLLTQLSRYASMMKVSYKKASVRVEMDYLLNGSVLRGTVKSECVEARTFFRVESDAPQERVLQLIRNAKQGCFAESMIQAPVPLKSEVELNGNPIAL